MIQKNLKQPVLKLPSKKQIKLLYILSYKSRSMICGKTKKINLSYQQNVKNV